MQGRKPYLKEGVAVRYLLSSFQHAENDLRLKWRLSAAVQFELLTAMF